MKYIPTSKNIIAVIVFIFTNLFYFNSNASNDSRGNDESPLSSCYLGCGLGIGRHASPRGVSASFILSNNWGGSISYKVKNFLPLNLPGDYETSFGMIEPSDKMRAVSLCLMKEFPGESPKVRFGIEAGPSWVAYQELYFDYAAASSKLLNFNSNYVITSATEKTVGLSLRAKTELLPTSGFGLEVAAFGNINRLRPFGGIEIYLIFGTLRDKITE
jgi:hypothetical protein